MDKKEMYTELAALFHSFADSLLEGVRFWITGKTDPDTRGDVNLFMVPRSH